MFHIATTIVKAGVTMLGIKEFNAYDISAKVRYYMVIFSHK